MQSDSVKKLKASFVPTMMTAAQVRTPATPNLESTCLTFTPSMANRTLLLMQCAQPYSDRALSGLARSLVLRRRTQVAQYTVRGVAQGRYIIGSPDRGANMIIGSRCLPSD